MLLFILPIYRVSVAKWEEEFENKMNEELSSLYDDEKYLEKAKQRYINNYQLHWKYNDVVAWLELYLEFNKIKGRVFASSKKRFVRGFKPTYDHNFKAGGIEVSISNKSSMEIADELIGDVKEFVKRSYPKRSVDLTPLAIAKYLDYQKISQDKK